MTLSIAPGGRWLIVGTVRRSIFYWDLDSAKPEPVWLLPCDGISKTLGRYTEAAAIDFLVERSDSLAGFVIAFVGRDGKCLVTL